MSGALWTANDIAAVTGGEIIGGDAWEVFGISIDSRSLEAGELFVALQGTQADGHEFIPAAFAKDAAGALVSRVVGDAKGPLILVNDTREALTRLARAARSRTAAKIVAVTGSVGKTSTKEALRLALGRAQTTHASAASFNNDIGVPLSLARMPASSEFGVFELGMNHAGELTPLSRLVRPHVALITGVEQAHSAFFPSLEAIADAKAEIFAGLEPGGVAILNRDNRFFDHLAAIARAAGVARIISYGFAEDADVRVMKHALLEDVSCITARVLDETVIYKVGAPGRHWVQNSLAVLATVKAFDADLGLAALALADMMPVKGRGQRHKVRVDGRFSILVVDESYNANPASMRAALDTLGNITVAAPGSAKSSRGRRIAVLGDMKELGEAGPRLHAGLAAAIVEADVDQVITVGELMSHLAKALPANQLLAQVATADEAARTLIANLMPNDVVMVKGSLSMAMVKVVNALLALDRGERRLAANG